MANAIGTIYALDQCNCLYICTGKAIDDIRTQLVDSYYKALLKMLRYNFIQKCRVQTHYHQFVTLLQMTAPWPTTLREWQMTGPKAWNPDQSETCMLPLQPHNLPASFQHVQMNSTCNSIVHAVSEKNSKTTVVRPHLNIYTFRKDRWPLHKPHFTYNKLETECKGAFHSVGNFRLVRWIASIHQFNLGL